ncbi:poly-gamma-glutamate synthesis protein (capsule biosynthesis protein) [Terribacillus halophilus]|uniref:Poly-gamma-glutamate synthesis protein (Capsule biosynthesis protein) n=1 Tax=Terribacillus halophilus TaxID=361279 RepID=A0A1G6RYB0_9BACI|nr:CapA family protein [Terribacillus halophilus]SDD08915.1 poly-gamma-glutamate synthesis protein (capsule biosynthesis protein) [Terribacillus halophilus]
MKIKAFFVILSSFVILAACSGGVPLEQPKAMHAVQQNIIELEPKEPPVISSSISITAVGDVLLHSSIYSEAKNGTGYDFDPMFGDIKPYLGESTLTVANQESIMGGEALGISSYPTFNSPDEIGNTLKDVGVDVVTMANNHTLDQGEAGVEHATAQYEKIGMAYTGAYRNKDDSEKLTIEKTEGISVAFLSYTYGTNGIAIPDGKDYLVNLIDKQKIKEDIKKAKQEADAIIVSLHFGIEYEHDPNDEQKELAQYVADQGATAVLGCHPHVLQPVEWLTGKDGNKTLVIYSLGNFIAAQEETDRRIGAAFQFDIVKDGKKATATSPKMLLTYLSFTDWHHYRIEPMYQLPELKHEYEEKKTHMAKLAPDLSFMEESPSS